MTNLHSQIEELKVHEPTIAVKMSADEFNAVVDKAVELALVAAREVWNKTLLQGTEGWNAGVNAKIDAIDTLIESLKA